MLGRLADFALLSRPISRPRNRAGAPPRPSPPSRDSAADIRFRKPAAHPRGLTFRGVERDPQAPPTVSIWASPVGAPSGDNAPSPLGCRGSAPTGDAARADAPPNGLAPYRATQPNRSPFLPHAAAVSAVTIGRCIHRRLSVSIALSCRHTRIRVTIPSPLVGASDLLYIAEPVSVFSNDEGVKKARL